MRKILVQLRPEMLDDLGLKAALEWQVQEFQTRSGIETHFAFALDEGGLDAERTMAVYRIVQESLTNVARHAHASRVEVSVTHADGHVLLRVRDDGRGIAPDEMRKAKSFGILGMRERALMFGGDVDISGAPGRGTTVSVRVPLRSDE